MMHPKFMNICDRPLYLLLVSSFLLLSTFNTNISFSEPLRGEGMSSWDIKTSEKEACDKAEILAKNNVLAKLGLEKIKSNQIEACTDSGDSVNCEMYQNTFNTISGGYIKNFEVLNKDKIYGKCIDCPILVGIKKECANADGNIIVLRKEMFICEPCTTKRFKSKPYEDLPYKKCPHCGILGKPNPGQCNYLYCNDHRWCYICQARLPLDNFGHNHHFWIGKGSSPYDFNCRVFSNNNQPTYIMEKYADTFINYYLGFLKSEPSEIFTLHPMLITK